MGKNAYMFGTGFKSQFTDFLKWLVIGHKAQQNAKLVSLGKIRKFGGSMQKQKDMSHGER